MENVKYLLERPVWMLMLVPAVLILVVIFLTMKKERRRQKKTVVSLALHGVIAVILTVLAAGFGIISETDRQSTVILVDVSDSTLAVREDMTAFCESLLKEFPERNVKGVVLFGQDTVFVGTKNLWGGMSLKKADVSGTDITALWSLWIAMPTSESFSCRTERRPLVMHSTQPVGWQRRGFASTPYILIQTN